MNHLDLCLEVVSRSCQPLRYVRRWISRKPLEIETWFQRTANRKWHMGIKWSRDQWRYVTLKGQSWPQYAYSAISRKRMDLETPFQWTTNRKWHGCQMITWSMTSRDPQRCCEAVRSAILATAWLLVYFNYACFRCFIIIGCQQKSASYVINPPHGFSWASFS